MKEIQLIDIQWNSYNGFIFDFLHLSFGSFEGSLLGFYWSKDHLIFNIAFFDIEIKSPFI